MVAERASFHEDMMELQQLGICCFEAF